MFEIINIENKVKLECMVVGYQFPDSPNDNWCLLKVIITQNDHIIEIIDPTIETTELKSIYEWFKCLSENRLPEYSWLTFTEPCISFNFLAYQNEKVRISIELSHELQPPFELNQFQDKSNDWQIVFELNNVNFVKILNGIRTTMREYPVRGKN